MRWIQEFDLFLFDMDGLLVDTERLHFQAYQMLCNEHNRELPWNFSEYIHLAHSSHDGLKNALLPLIGGESWEPLYALKKNIYQALLLKGKLELMPGVGSLLEELATTRSKRCVVTHSTKEQVDAILHLLPILKTIPMWITREDYKNPKPSPDGYLKAIELLADPGDRVIGFEDSLRGIQSLRGTHAVAVLICDLNHPQLRNSQLKDTVYFTSFAKIPRNFTRAF